MSKKKRAPSMTEDNLIKVIEILDTWDGPLTWDLLIEAVCREIGYTYSRFTLFEYPSVANAFQVRKEAIRRTKEGNPRPASTPRDSRIAGAIEQLERYKARIERLEHENKLFLEQFVVWAHNAQRNSITIDMLNQPMVKPARDATRVGKNKVTSLNLKQK